MIAAEHVVEVVRDPARQAAEALHLLGLEELQADAIAIRFGLFERADVLAEHRHAQGLAVVLHDVDRQKERVCARGTTGTRA